MAAHAKLPASPQSPKQQPAASASKRSRESFDKSRTGTPVSETFKKAEDQNDCSGLPAFLRQTNAGKPLRARHASLQASYRMQDNASNPSQKSSPDSSSCTGSSITASDKAGMTRIPLVPGRTRILWKLDFAIAMLIFGHGPAVESA